MKRLFQTKVLVMKRVIEGMILLMVLFSACDTTRLVPKGDALYTGAAVKITDSTLSKKTKKQITHLTQPLIRPVPNSKFLGMPIKLWLYDLAGNPDKKSFVRRFLRKIGQPPVLSSSAAVDYNDKVLQNFQQNIGYFQATASGVLTTKAKKAHATYTLGPGPLYTLGTVQFDTDSSTLGKAIKATSPNSLLRVGDPFNLELIKSERVRIDAYLKERGYYYFNPDLLILNADSTAGNHTVAIRLLVKSQAPLIARKPYIIDQVYIYPNYRMDRQKSDTNHAGKYIYGGYYIVDSSRKFKPQLFPRVLRFDSGDVYNRTDHNLTLSRLINLNVFKFVNNRFENTSNARSDTGSLNAYYYLTPLPKKSITAELSGNTKSDNYVGSLITLTFKNRNIFKAAEALSFHATTGSEVQYSGNERGYNTYTLGAGVTLTTPEFIVPFFHLNTTNAFVPTTKIDLSYNLLNRIKLYTLNSISTQLGYSWKPNAREQNDFNPFVINYVKALNITQKYLDSIATDPVLKHAVDTQFVIGSNYSYTYDPLINRPNASGIYFNGLVDVSGNFAGLIIQPDAFDGKKRIFQTQISQYIKTQLESRYYCTFSPTARLANRIIAGFGYPYGNSSQLPFIKQFFIGGNNSIRAFRSRSLGPGTYRDPKSDSLSFFPDESGDIKLELNSELRFKLNKLLEGAVFIDAGNIWLYNKDSTRPGAEFSSQFLNQLAAGAGFGLRINLTILLLRIDLATPLREPWLAQGQRWVLKQIDFGSPTWRRQNLVLNLAIGYPF